MSRSAASIQGNSGILVIEEEVQEETGVQPEGSSNKGGMVLEQGEDGNLRQDGEARNCFRENSEKARRRNLLECSLALIFIKVGRDSGSSTVEDMLDILKDEMFDLQTFMRKVKCLKDCEKVVSCFMENRK